MAQCNNNLGRSRCDYPPAFVLVNKFDSSSIDLSLKFRVSHFDIGLDVKSDLVRMIEILFKEHGIEIPFLRQDVHIR